MHAAALIGQVVPFWANYFRRFVFSQPPNQIPTPISRDGGWGLSTMAHFALRDEHALVITLNPLDADYFGMQVADPWGLASTYVDRTGSLSLSQVQRNEDGNVTYVIAASNPGVHNWLDTGGLDRGTLVARWQGVTSSPDRAPAVLSARQLPIKALDGLTVKPPQQFSRAAHARRLHERAKQYRRRLCGSAANDADTPA
jgi:hypothetical protein